MQSLVLLFKTSQKLLIIGLCCLAVSGCSNLRFPGVFRIDIGQGNIITADMIQKLKVGMTKRQVEYVMGSAMIQDPFTPERWDYVYSYETGEGAFVENKLSLYFEGERLQRIDDSRLKDPEKVREKLVDAIKEQRS
ncbi:MAG: outer membrane protein assembly factor BamE [Ketobacteraceae bacterium]|nr:outer membrane protein assembly factor BamE [Ketobacteraceae bacterium]